MAVSAEGKRHCIMDEWDFSSYVEPNSQIAAAVVYDTQRDIFLLLPSKNNPAPRRGSSPSAKHKLSLRELQILQLVAAGFANKQMAAKLRISERTVKVHLQSIFLRLAARSRNEAVARAFQDGWMRFSRQVHSEKNL